MTSQQSETPSHPILGCAVDIAVLVGKVSATSAVFMTPEEKRVALVQLGRDEAMLAELRLRVLAAADLDQVGAAVGASSTAAWLVHQTRQARESAAADIRFAASLDGQFEQTRAALGAGAVNVAQAKVILAAVNRLPERVSAEDALAAEAHLISLADEFDAPGLAKLGRRLFEVIDPDAADDEEGRALEKQEARARAKAAFSIRSNGDGTHCGTFKIPDLHASILKKALQAITAPRRHGDDRHDADGKKLPYPTLLGQGLMELLEHLPADTLPTTGGMAATIVVTLDYVTLLSALGAATLDDGTRISASEARRLACEAGIIPMVLGGDSQPLDVGRERRLHTKSQRIAMAHRDGGCLAENCDRPPAWCEAHHETSWADGGDTSLENGGLRCAFHHHLEHNPSYTKSRLPSRQIRYRRRQ